MDVSLTLTVPEDVDPVAFTGAVQAVIPDAEVAFTAGRVEVGVYLRGDKSLTPARPA
jgi:hypothetical protein